MSLVTPPAMHSLGSNEYTARTDRRIVQALLGGAGREGVVGPSDFLVSPTAPASMSVQVAGGLAFIDGDAVARQGTYLAESTGTVIVGPLSAPAAGLERRDLIVVRDYDQSPDGGSAGTDQQVLEVVQGTATASGAVAPTAPAGALALAEVYLDDATASIDAAALTDVRRRAATGGGGAPSVRVTLSNYTSPITDANTDTPVEWHLAEHDPRGMFEGSEGSPIDHVTVRDAGVYLIEWHLQVYGIGGNYAYGALLLNGTVPDNVTVDKQPSDPADTTGASGTLHLQGSDVMALSPGDEVGVNVRAGSTAPSGFVSGGHLSVTRLSPEA